MVYVSRWSRWRDRSGVQGHWNGNAMSQSTSQRGRRLFHMVQEQPGQGDAQVQATFRVCQVRRHQAWSTRYYCFFVFRKWYKKINTWINLLFCINILVLHYKYKFIKWCWFGFRNSSENRHRLQQIPPSCQGSSSDHQVQRPCLFLLCLLGRALRTVHKPSVCGPVWSASDPATASQSTYVCVTVSNINLLCVKDLWMFVFQF